MTFLTSSHNIDYFLQAIEDLNEETDVVSAGITFHGFSVIKDSNPIKNTLNVCEKLFSSLISGVVVEDRAPSDSITYTTTYHNIPTIGITNREAILSDKSIYPTYGRTVASFSNQADVWVEILNHFNFNCVVFIHSNDINGRRVQKRFEVLADVSNIKVETVIEYEPSFPDISKQL
ncbi:unnamed protein product, partial [Medioppia subpectinata]